MINESDIEAMGYAYYSDPVKLLQTPMDMVREFARVTDQKPDPDLYENLIEEEFYEWGEVGLSTDENLDKKEDLKELADIVYVIYGYANAMGYNLDEAIRRVHRNNLGRCVQQDGTVKRREDGKIIKNPDYPKVDLSDLV